MNRLLFLVSIVLVASGVVYYFLEEASTDDSFYMQNVYGKNNRGSANNFEGVSSKNYSVLNEEHNYDEVEIKRVTRKLEACLFELDYKVDNYNEEKKNLEIFLDSYENVEEGLINLLLSKSIGREDVYSFYRNQILLDWFTSTERLNVRGKKAAAVSADYMKLKKFVENDDLDAIKSWFKDHEYYATEKYTLNSKGVSVYLDASTLVASFFDQLSSESKKWILNNVVFNAMSIESAITSGIDASLIGEIIDATPNPTAIFVQGNELSNILLVALEQDGEDLLNMVLSKVDFGRQNVIAPLVNRYYAELASQSKLTQSDRNKIEYLSSHGISPAVFKDGGGRMVLIGYEGNKNISEQLGALGVNISQEDLYNNFGGNDVGVAKSVFDNYIESEKEKVILSAKCKGWEEKALALEPQFSPYDIYSDKAFDNEIDRLSFLRGKSPVLYDIAVSKLLKNVSTNDYSVNLPEGSSEDELVEFYKDIDTKPPYIQHLAVKKLCVKYGIDIVYDIVDRGWYIDFSNLEGQGCTKENESMLDLNAEYLSSQNLTPSLVYRGLQDLRLDEVKQLLLEAKPTHGFPGGRDSLVLVLDRIVPFKAKPSKDYFIILELLLDSTELNKHHFTRLHRLSLKYPEYFSELEMKFPRLKVANEYPFSMFNSYF